MMVLGHTAISLTVGSVLFNYSHSFLGFIWFLITGVFVDLDHYIDYIIEKGISFNPKEVHDTCKYSYINFRKLILILHSYEILILLWLAVFIFNLGIIWKCIAISFTLHLLLDQMFNPVYPFSYFFWFRMLNKFDTKKIFIQTRR